MIKTICDKCGSEVKMGLEERYIASFNDLDVEIKVEINSTLQVPIDLCEFCYRDVMNCAVSFFSANRILNKPIAIVVQSKTTIDEDVPF